jgi:lysophospholipase L1-like esterase
MSPPAPPRPIRERGAKLVTWSGRPAVVLLRRLAVLATTMLTIAGTSIAPAAHAEDAARDVHWVGTWSASPQAASSPVQLGGRTIRQIVRVSIGGKLVRVRLSNAYGTDSLAIGAARVALRSTGASIATGSDRVLTFNGSPSTTIPPGAVAVSDPVKLQVPDLGDLAVSIHIPGNAAAATEHSVGLQTTYISAEGDYSGADSLPTASTTQSYYLVTGIEVDAARNSRAVVVLGDSITDGYHSTPDANRRWPDRLAERLHAQKGGSKVAVLNAGITANRILHNTVGTNALARLDRDVLVQSGARYLIVLQGINDIGFPGSVTTAEIIAGHRQIIDRAHAMGLKVYGGTLTPFQAYLSGIYYTPDGEAQRQAVNQWIRTGKAYDAVIDFDRAIRDPGNPATILPAYDSGDNLHPNDAGYKAMADAVDLSLFKAGIPARRTVDAKGPSAQPGKPKAAPCPCAS